MQRVVVGIDGTEESTDALAWAAETVGASGELQIVTAMAPPTVFEVDGCPAKPDERSAFVQRRLSAVVTRQLGDTETAWTVEVTDQEASAALAEIAAASRADAIVVGATAVQGVAKTIGSTVRHLLQKLPCPLIVVPRETSTSLSDGAPIIVGVGHSEATDAAARWAGALADKRSLPIGLVRALGDAPVFQPDGLLDLVGLYLGAGVRAEWGRADLTKLAQDVQQSTEHDLSIAVSSRTGPPSLRLVEASTSASLLVIGQRWSMMHRRGVEPHPLRYAIAHARCPVAIVPEHAVDHHEEPDGRSGR